MTACARPPRSSLCCAFSSVRLLFCVQLYPRRSGRALTLTGPGIRDRQSLRASPLPGDIGERLVANRSLFPRGVDLILAAANEVAALPRSVHVAGEEA